MVYVWHPFSLCFGIIFSSIYVTIWSPAFFEKAQNALNCNLLLKGGSVMGTNTTYLSNTVNEMFGCNLKTLINWYRVQYAKEMLRRGICRLKDIPFVCGFASKSTFYVSFKRCEGVTPNHFISACNSEKNG